MITSDTPETDAQVILCHGIPDGFNPPEHSYVSSKFASKLERERDEANEELSKKYVEYDQLFDAAEKIKIERDEARAAIPDGEWVAYEEHKKVHDAASRLLVAINKQLPIGSFSLISHEYHALKDAIYGKEGAK